MHKALEIFDRVARQYKSDLDSAHAEICRLAGIDPATHTWPDWSPQANTLRWLPECREELAAALPAAKTEGE